MGCRGGKRELPLTSIEIKLLMVISEDEKGRDMGWQSKSTFGVSSLKYDAKKPAAFSLSIEMWLEIVSGLPTSGAREFIWKPV